MLHKNKRVSRPFRPVLWSQTAGYTLAPLDAQEMLKNFGTTRLLYCLVMNTTIASSYHSSIKVSTFRFDFFLFLIQNTVFVDVESLVDALIQKILVKMYLERIQGFTLHNLWS